MKCIIVEDQPPAQRILKKYIADMGNIELLNSFSDPLEALSFLKKNTVDFILLDIHLPKLTGIDFIKALSNPPSIILTTAFPDFALESYDLDVVDYLLKPFSFPRFVRAINKLGHNRVSEANESLSVFIKSGYDHVKVNLTEIQYIKSDHDYVEIHTPDKKLLSSEALKQWLEKYPSIFLRVHKSYLINKHNIDVVSSGTIKLKHNHVIPIGRAYKEEVHKLYNPT